MVCELDIYKHYYYFLNVYKRRPNVFYIMKKTYLALTLLLSFISFAQEESSSCDNLYSNVTYALSHTKKAIEVTGFDHQVYYAERALSMFEKSKDDILKCTCSNAEEKSFQATSHLKKAVDPADWYAGRFYSKKALNEINELITALDNCSTESLKASNQADLDKDLAISTESNQDIEANHLEYNAYLDDLNSSIEKLLLQLQKDFASKNESDAVQKKYYSEQTKKLLQSAILQIDDANE